MKKQTKPQKQSVVVTTQQKAERLAFDVIGRTARSLQRSLKAEIRNEGLPAAAANIDAAFFIEQLAKSLQIAAATAYEVLEQHVDPSVWPKGSYKRKIAKVLLKLQIELDAASPRRAKLL